MPATKVRRASRSAEVPFERRTFRSDDAAMSDERHFVGHAAVYNQRTAIGNPLTWGFYEEVARGAFDKTVNDGADVVFDWDHDTRWILARTGNGTLRLNPADVDGLAVDADMAPVSYANDLRVLVERGDVAGMSFQFQVVKDEWRTEQVETSDGQSADVEVRTIQECRLIDVTATALPAYAGTDTDLRHAASLARESRSIRGVASPRVSKRAADADGDDDIAVLAQAVDAAIDEAIALLADVDVSTLPTPVAQAVGLIRGADVSVDKLLAVLGVDDPDEDDDEGTGDERSRREPASTTRAESDESEPRNSTRDAVAQRAKRMGAFAALHGLVPDRREDPSNV
jgi:HK97 family phage prohead protease